MLINLYDSNFYPRQSCSVLGQESTYIEYVERLRKFDGITLFTDEWINNPIVDEVNSKYKAGWLHEPYCLHPETYKRVYENHNRFDFILTYNKELIESNPEKFKLCVYAGTWIDSLDWGIKPKTKLCSLLVGSKLSTEGHKLRREAAELAESEFNHNVDLYGIKGTPVNYSQETKLQVLENYCFSIVTETCREDNLFTEWLLDCFAVGTIPIYWGAPNIHEFFDVQGIFQFDTLYRLEKILHSLSFELWISKLNSAYLNLLKMREYAVTEDWLYLNVFKELV